MSRHVHLSGLAVDAALAELVEREILINLPAETFWSGYAAILRDLVPENRALLRRREELQSRIDDWHIANPGMPDPAAYRAFLTEIGYLAPEPAPFRIGTSGVDAEIATMSGPQLVVPVTNARFALNAVNARWGSLYDALYGTDAVPGARSGSHDPARAAAVVARAKAHLDRALPLAGASWAELDDITLRDGRPVLTAGEREVMLSGADTFVGYRHEGTTLGLLWRANGLGIEIRVDREAMIGRDDPAGISDVRLEAALTAIMDCEDSVATVDAEDKCLAYRNWLGLMRGDLRESFVKDGRSVDRVMNRDLNFTTPDGSPIAVSGRALMLVRNVGHLMTTDAVLMDGEETPEGILDAAITVAAAMHDLKKSEGPRNSGTRSIYVVKPKMHGPEEAAFAERLYSRVEDLLSLPRNTVKLGLMDEERRTSVNLPASMAEIRDRLVFINTGFLDRTGDEIHTSMRAGPMVPKNEMRRSGWLAAYEDGNVDAGLGSGLPGRGQIGKGMWAKPDAMAEMLEVKIGHPMSGASTAWVPSPTAAVLHATHYHLVDVRARQEELRTRTRASLDALLTPPLLAGRNLDPALVRRAMDDSVQSILGYVVRWVDQGIGCSKVPDIDDVALMEDRATLRISSQLLANWLMHGLITRDEIEESLRRMAVQVDNQNAGDPAYRAMAPGYDGLAFHAARELILEGAVQPSGYTEPILHRYRRDAKAQARLAG